MSYSPVKVQASLQQQIQRRISHESPTKYDIDFYLRKINRLENDLNQAHDELSKARVRLRRSQDFQIKYQLLMRQNSNILNDLDKKQKQYHSLRTRNQIVKSELDDKNYQMESWNQEKKLLFQQIQLLKSKCQQLQEKKKYESATVKQKVDSHIKNQVQTIKKQFVQRQQQLTNQVRILKKVIHEKQTIENVVTSKVEKIRVDKDKQISRLSKIIQAKKEEIAEMARQKNQQNDKLREKFEKMFNFQIQNLRKNLDDQDEVFDIEINGLRQLLGLKNQQITKLLKQLKQLSQQSQKQRENYMKQIAALKDRIYKVQRQNQIQLYNVKQRLSKIHSLQIQTLQKNYNDLINSLKSDKVSLQKIVQEGVKLAEMERKDAQRVKQELIDRLKQRDARINQLQQRIKQTGDINANQMKTLHESFHQIQTEKQNMTTEYQTNVDFLNQQVAKLVTKVEVKNNQIKMMYQEIALVKKHHSQSIKQIQDKWKQEREQRQKQREKQRDRRQKLQDQIRLKEKQWKTKQRQIQRLRQIEQKQKNKLKFICEQLEKDIERLNNYNKQLDQNLKKEYKKNQLSTLDTGGVRRELTAQLQRQKSQLQAIKRMEVDNIKKKFQIQITRLTNQNQKINTDLLKKQLALDELQSQFKKLEHINKNIDKINKQKLIQYQKKMATLNNEVLLSQNLYKSFMQAKSRQK